MGRFCIGGKFDGEGEWCFYGGFGGFVYCSW